MTKQVILITLEQCQEATNDRQTSMPFINVHTLMNKAVLRVFINLFALLRKCRNMIKI